MVIGASGAQFREYVAQVISKWRGRIEIMSTITPWIVRHEVQLLINRIYNKFRNQKCLLRISFERKRLSARNGRKNHVGIQLQVSSYKRFKSDACNYKLTCSRADYVTNRRSENQSRSRNLLQIRSLRENHNFKPTFPSSWTFACSN